MGYFETEYFDVENLRFLKLLTKEEIQINNVRVVGKGLQVTNKILNHFTLSKDDETIRLIRIILQQ